MNSTLKLMLAGLLAAIFLNGCGKNTPATVLPPTGVDLTVNGQSLNFSWTAGENVDHYRILVNADGASGFTVDPAATNIANTATTHSLIINIHQINWLSAQYIIEGCNADESSCVAPLNQIFSLSAFVLPPTGVGLTVNSQSLDFSWTAGGNVDHYRILVNADGASGFTVDPAATNIANTATTHSLIINVHQINWLSAQYIIEGCNADESTCVASPNQTLALIDSVAATVYAKASNTDAGDRFGWSASLSSDGNTLAVGAIAEGSVATGIDGNELDNTALNSGAVYVFIKTGNVWNQQAYIKASNTGAGDKFGASVFLSSDGNTLAVGAEGEASAATGIAGNELDDTAASSGAAYIFSRSGTAWSQQAYIKASNTEAGDRFGWSISLSADSNTLAVGAIAEDSAATGIAGNDADNTAINSGAVYIFSKIGNAWAQQAYVKASNTGRGDQFGRSIALNSDGNTLAVGGYGEASAATGIGGNEADNTAGSSGAVYLFNRSGTAWSQQAYVKASNTEANDFFGASVSLSSDGNTLAVGALREDSIATGIGGNEADNSITNSGAAYVFSNIGGTWSQQAYVKASNTRAFDLFGTSVFLSQDGNTLAVGARQEDSLSVGIGGNQTNKVIGQNSGAVYVFSKMSGVRQQQAYVKASNAGKNDLFGASVSLSSDGNTLAVGGYGEGSATKGIGSSNQTNNLAAEAGAIYIY